MPRVSGSEFSRVRWLVDKHGVHGRDVGANEVFHVVQQWRIADVLGEDVVPIEVLELNRKAMCNICYVHSPYVTSSAWSTLLTIRSWDCPVKSFRETSFIRVIPP